MARPLPALGAQELAIMKVVWRLKDVSVREVYETLRERQPWKAVYERDHAWLGGLMEQHYAGDDTNVKILGASGFNAEFATMLNAACANATGNC